MRMTVTPGPTSSGGNHCTSTSLSRQAYRAERYLRLSERHKGVRRMYCEHIEWANQNSGMGHMWDGSDKDDTHRYLALAGVKA